MSLLIDTDVLIDVALNREPHVRYSAQILDASQEWKIKSFIAWHSRANFYYLVSSPKTNEAAKDFIRDLLQFVEIAQTHTKDAIFALELPIADFEDALQIAAARVCKSDYIMTRNEKHFRQSPIPAITPKLFCEQFNKNSD